MDDRPSPAQVEAQVETDAEDGNGYPLREEATEPLPPPLLPAETSEEIYAAPVEPKPPRRRRVRPANPWPVLLAVLLLLASLGVAYAVTRPGRSTHTDGTPPAAGAAAAEPAPPGPPGTTTSAPTPSAPHPAAAPPQPTSVSVPSVVGSSLARAVSELKQANLPAVVARVASDAPEGRVVAQQPAPGTKVPEGGRVRVSVATQPLATVPDLTGVQGLSAVHTLQADHLVASLRYVPSTEPARRVVSQWPSAGNRVRRGTSVRLNLSQGLRPRATVPTVVGEDEASARSNLEARGFTVRSLDRTSSDTTEDGMVVDQSPSAGTSASHGAAVTIWVGRTSGD